jgi:predicted amidohydrolase
MKDVRVALAQIAVEPLDSKKNIDRMLRICDEVGSGADLLVFPELADLGYVRERDRVFGAQYLSAAEPVPGPVTDALGEAARRYGVHIVAGVAERHPSIAATAFNSAVLIDASGRVAGVQRKLHLAGEERHYFVTGRAINVFDTDLGRLTISICYDNYFPEVARAAALRGAEIVCGVFNIPDRADWRERLAALASVRAYENMNHVVFVNRVGTDAGVPYGGESAIASPPGRVIARGPCLEEAIVTATLRSQAIAEERAWRPIFADRRPEVYRLDEAEGGQ